eukprot:6301646-Pyramimonas_sp.AAC.2
MMWFGLGLAGSATTRATRRTDGRDARQRAYLAPQNLHHLRRVVESSGGIAVQVRRFAARIAAVRYSARCLSSYDAQPRSQCACARAWRRAANSVCRHKRGGAIGPRQAKKECRSRPGLRYPMLLYRDFMGRIVNAAPHDTVSHGRGVSAARSCVGGSASNAH